MATKVLDATAIRPTSNGAKEQIEYQLPYVAEVTVKGVADILFHAWNNEAVAEKAKAAKGSKSKKTDNIESYVYRTPKGTLGIKGESLHMAIVAAAKFQQDPRSKRKSAADLMKAAVFPLTVLADTGAKDWDYIDRRRVRVQQDAITRERPALREGWQATFLFQVNLPEYVSPTFLNDLIAQAGRLCGLGDHRPTYGRFQVVRFETREV